jgi:hypothetical protein
MSNIKGLEQLKQAYIIESIDEDVIGTTKEKLTYIKNCLEKEAYYANNLKRFKGSYMLCLADHLQGLPSYFNHAYMYDDILAIGMNWAYDLSTSKKESDFIDKWFNILSNTILHLMKKEGVK